ncbi:MAG TPA: GNAT family N-acetyltransferase [Patescibacteria group bacterium]|nr:GNAT family N-acetyltransferase [Patescibacteria group bacterium]
MNSFEVPDHIQGDRKVFYIFARNGNEDLGSLFGKTIKNSAFVEMLNVGLNERGNGIGSALLNRFVQEAKENGARDIRATIGSLDIPKLEEFYRKNNFEIDDEYATMRL